MMALCTCHVIFTFESNAHYKNTEPVQYLHGNFFFHIFLRASSCIYNDVIFSQNNVCMYAYVWCRRRRNHRADSVRFKRIDFYYLFVSKRTTILRARVKIDKQMRFRNIRFFFCRSHYSRILPLYLVNFKCARLI